MFIFVAIFAGPSMGGEWKLTGFVGVDSQAFWLDGRFPDQEDGVNLPLIAQPEFYWRSEDGKQRVSIVGFARGDLQDSQRSHADLRETFWGIDSEIWDLTVGVGKVFWGVTESRHLVDVINQTDLVEDIDQEGIVTLSAV